MADSAFQALGGSMAVNLEKKIFFQKARKLQISVGYFGSVRKDGLNENVNS